MKSFKNPKIPPHSSAPVSKSGHIHKYSIYMQSRDSSWLNRNINADVETEDTAEPIEEDIRD